MSLERLSYLLIPNTHQNMTDLLNLEAVASDFVILILNNYVEFR